MPKGWGSVSWRAGYRLLHEQADNPAHAEEQNGVDDGHEESKADFALCTHVLRGIFSLQTLQEEADDQRDAEGLRKGQRLGTESAHDEPRPQGLQNPAVHNGAEDDHNQTADES